ncbi:hypothetical protein X801_07713, partial [Opisthorchis viverrini]
MDVDQPAPEKPDSSAPGGGTLASAAALLGAASTGVLTSDLDVLHDTGFLQSVLQGLAGVDTKDKDVQKAISDLSKAPSKDKTPPKKDDTKKDDP